ncbi:MAG TPA: BON domain-containing protein [Xanthomonadaceae bacterium]|nr:BON domain-containing protein [Xanthomonadaceae bacterium]
MASKPESSPDKKRDQQRELQHDRPSVTNRAWGTSHDPGDQSFGYPGQGGYGDFRTRDIDDAPVMDPPAREAASEQPRARPDDRLRESVADRLDSHGKLDTNQVLVAAEDGVVTLTGEVSESWMKDCAEDIARTVTGVREVRNTVSCDDGSASFGPPGEAVRNDR